jgi:hypothetical protein
MAPNPHTNLLNVYIQLANEMGFQKKKKGVLCFHVWSLTEITDKNGPETWSFP